MLRVSLPGVRPSISCAQGAAKLGSMYQAKRSGEGFEEPAQKRVEADYSMQMQQDAAFMASMQGFPPQPGVMPGFFMPMAGYGSAVPTAPGFAGQQHFGQQAAGQSQGAKASTPYQEKVRAEEEMKRQADLPAVQAWLTELSELSAEAEAQIALLKDYALPLAGTDLSEDDLLRQASLLDNGVTMAKAAQKACSDAIIGKKLAMSEEHRAEMMKILSRVNNEMPRDVEAAVGSANAARRRAQETKEKRLRLEAAKREEERLEALFVKHDKDSDGFLNGPEMVAFASEEYKFDIPEEKVSSILAQVGRGKPGVAKDQIARLRTMVGIAREEAKQKQRRLEKAEAERKAKEDAERKS